MLLYIGKIISIELIYMQKDQKLINEVKRSILEGYDVIPASVKINYSLKQIGVMNIYMNYFYEYPHSFFLKLQQLQHLQI